MKVGWIAGYWIVAASSLFGFQAAPAAAPPPPPATSSIEGQVFNLATGAPLKRANVRLVGIGRRQSGGMPAMLAKETDDQGRFAFLNLEAARYQLTAERQGFLRQSYGGRKYNTSGTPIAINPDQHVKDIVLKLSPQSVISGKVLDEDGEPVANVQVRAFRYGYRSGKKQWIPAGNGSTSDIGEYRIPNLEPGSYRVGTNAPGRGNMGMQTSSNEPLPEGGELQYAATFYPSTLDETGAVPVEVGPGGEIRGIDVRLVKSRVFRIRGRVAAQPGRNNPMVMLVSKDGARAVPNMSPARPPENRFEIRGVPPGSYIVYAQFGGGPQQSIAYQAVEVRGNHVDGLVLNLTPGSEIGGTVKVVDANAPIDTANVAVMLRPTLQFGAPPRAKVVGGAFTLQNVVPLHYAVTVTGMPENCFVKSIRYGGRDVPEDGVDITAGGTLDVVLSATAGSIKASVVDKDGKASPGAMVALVPKEGGTIRGNSADENGGVSFSGLKPGEYLLIGWEDIPPGAYADPDFVKPYEGRGQTVKLEPAAAQAIQLKVIPAE